jgi:hypothetical protein
MVERAELFGERRTMEEMPSFQRFLAAEKSGKTEKYPGQTENENRRRRLVLLAVS